MRRKQRIDPDQQAFDRCRVHAGLNRERKHVRLQTVVRTEVGHFCALASSPVAVIARPRGSTGSLATFPAPSGLLEKALEIAILRRNI